MNESQNKIPLQKLIAKLCPDGVEFLPIGNVVNYEQPGKYIVASTNYSEKYKIPVLTAGQTFILGHTDETENIYPASKENPVIIFDDFTGAFKWVDFPFKVKSSAMKMLHANTEKTTLRYIFHMMGKINFSSDEHQRLWIGKYSSFPIPLPPMEVQREIVRILDKFTDLSALLETELVARKKQYEYYRDVLFNTGNKTEKRKIGDLTKVFSASRVHRKDWTSGGVPFLRSSDVISYYKGIPNSRGKAFISHELYEDLSAKSGKFEKDDILITGGGTIGIPYIVESDEPLYVKDADLICIKKCDTINSRFLYYYFLTSEFREYIGKITHDATIAHYTISQVQETPIPVLPISEQERIVNLLDKFDALCNDLSSGIPAEIAARKKQYEYYRDRLLTFREKIS